MINFENVTVSFEDKVVLKNFSAEIKEKGIILITGPSGCGKTTLTRLIMGLAYPDDGKVVREGVKISAVFQEDRLIPSLTALQNVELVSSRGEAKKRLFEVGLCEAEGLYPNELSGGMKRRVAIARALSFDADALILDEAFTGIDEPLALEIIKNITEEYKDRLIIAVTHRPELFENFPHDEIRLE